MTFDTSVVIDAFKIPMKDQEDLKVVQRIKAANRLKDAHNKGLIKVFYNGGEKSRDTNETNTFFQVRGPGILGFEGFSELGVSTTLVSEDFVELVQDILGVPDVSTPTGQHNMRDFALLVEHINSGRDIFVSADENKHINYTAEFASHGIVVISAMDAVSSLEEKGVL